MSGKLGFDIELEKFSGDELTYCQEAVKNFNRLQTVIGQGEIYRLISPYNNNSAAWMTISEDKSKAVLFNYNLNILTGDVFSKLVLKGLDPNKKYTIKEINLMPNQKPQFNRNEQTFSGDYLMKVGLDWYLRGSIKSSILEITSN